jgi:sugar phosphate isomerase/epimerase
MKISIMSGVFESSLEAGLFDADALLDILSDAGASGLELSWPWCKNSPPAWLTLLSAAQRRGFSFPNIYAPANLCSGNECENKEILRSLRQLFTFCRADVNCPLVLLYGSVPALGMSLSEGRRHYGQMLARCAELGAEYGVTVCIESYGGNPEFSSTSAQCLEILSHANSSLPRLNFDNGNVLLGDERPLSALESFKPLLIHVHIKDFQLRFPDDKKRLSSLSGLQYQNCALGDGAAEVALCIRRLHAIGYQGWLSLEMPPGNPDWIIRREVKFIAGVLQQLQTV